MMEENVVSAAGARYQLNATGIQQAIRDAGFVPRYRNQAYEDEPLPDVITSYSIHYTKLYEWHDTGYVGNLSYIRVSRRHLFI